MKKSCEKKAVTHIRYIAEQPEGALLKKQADTPVSGNICLNICLFYQKSNFCLSLSKKL